MREVNHNDRRRVISDVCNITKHFKPKFKHEADCYQICARLLNRDQK